MGVADMWKDKSLAPVPIRQNLQLITDIFLTPAVAAITHNDGSNVDVTNLMITAIRGFQKYCTSFQCDVPFCSATLTLKSPSAQYLFKDQGRSIEGRPTFKDRDSGHYLFYSQNKWNIGPTFEAEDALLASTCPYFGAVFEDPEAEPYVPNIRSWIECSRLCFDSEPPSPVCNFWQYDATTERCTLVTDYARMVSSSSDNDIYTGTKDCLGPNAQFVYGLCAEEHASRSMWVEPNSVGFLKDVRIEDFDPTSIMVVGGSGAGKDVGLLFQDNCPLPQLQDANSDNVLLLTPDNLLLSCGGDSHAQTCNFLDVAAATWKEHSSLREVREGSVGITLPGGSYIFGGMQNPRTSEFLPANSQTWEEGPAIYGDGIDRGCGVKVNDTALLLIGGYSGGRESKQVLMYSFGGWEPKTNLNEVRGATSCAMIGNNVVVAGGRDTSGDFLASTEIIPLTNYQPRIGGDLVTGRAYHRMVTFGGRHPQLLALGGAKSGTWHPTQLASIEEWDEMTEQWKESPIALNTPMDSFGALAIPPATICAGV